MSGGDQGGAGLDGGAERGWPRRTRRASGGRSVAALVDAVFAPGSADDAAGERTQRDDLQSLLAQSVRDLARRTAATRAVAWLARDDGSPLTAASVWKTDGDPPAPDADAFAALRMLTRATDLGGSQAGGALGWFARHGGLTAAIAVAPDGSDGRDPGQVVLAVGGAEDVPGRIRPRTLAMLEEVAEQLRGPLATHLAVARLARLDEGVRSLDRRAALGELVAEIVHEVRNPLVSVKTFLHLLPSRIDDREFLEDFREVVVEEVIRLERLLDSVLQHARPDSGDRIRGVARVEDAFEAIVRLADHRATERQVRLVPAIEPSVDDVAMARDALRQVVLNLVLNALDASPVGGSVVLRARARPARDGRWVEIRVEDDGPGIPPAERRRVFEAFYSTRPDRPGGLGLAISRRLVEAAGGTISVGEAPGGGAALTVRLPAAGPAVAADA